MPLRMPWPSAIGCGNFFRNSHLGSLPLATVVYCDNVSAIYMTANHIHHHRTKHIEIDIRFVRETVALGQVCILHVPSAHQFADIMTVRLYIYMCCACVYGRHVPGMVAGQPCLIREI